MYTRVAELRHMRPNDVYKLGVILDDNNGWKKLMEIIPKELNAQECSSDGALNWDEAVIKGFKYNNDHIRLIENTIKRSGETRLFSQILFDEWGTSGRKNERPTLGVLLQLLVKAELFRVADYVAVNYLNERPPERPLNGPAAAFDISLSSDIFNGIENLINESTEYPSTGALNDYANFDDSLSDNNKDFYTKYKRMDKDVIINKEAPIPPPRVQRAVRLLSKQQQQPMHQRISNEASTNVTENTIENINEDSILFRNLPKFSQLINQNEGSERHTSPQTQTNTNKNITSQINSIPNTESTSFSEAPIPLISVLGASATTAQGDNMINTQFNYYTASNSDLMLPAISALNLNGEHNNKSIKYEDFPIMSPAQGQGNQCVDIVISESSVVPEVVDKIDVASGKRKLGGNAYDKSEKNNGANDDDGDSDDDEGDRSVPNLSIFDQRSSNNDSSLTNVTGTSGDNSFDLSMNDCNSASNENIPCLSALK